MGFSSLLEKIKLLTCVLLILRVFLGKKTYPFVLVDIILSVSLIIILGTANRINRHCLFFIIFRLHLRLLFLDHTYSPVFRLTAHKTLCDCGPHRILDPQLVSPRPQQLGFDCVTFQHILCLDDWAIGQSLRDTKEGWIINICQILIQLLSVTRIRVIILFVILHEKYCWIGAHWRFWHLRPWMYPTSVK